MPSAQRRRPFAAAQHERAGSPRLLSTIFPRLPRVDLSAFRAVLLVGVSALVALALARLYPLALVAGQVLIPLLIALYIYDVDEFEGRPWLALLLTAGLGALGGVAVAWIAMATDPTSSAQAAGSQSASTWIRGVGVPLAAFACMLVGPLLLLRRSHFDDLLDGVTCGVTSAAATVAALALTQSAEVLAFGIRPPGEAVPWLIRLASLSLVTPALTVTAVGASAASLWIRYRAPGIDPNRLGRLARPVIALPLAASAMVASALLLLLLAPAPALAAQVGLALGTVLWLRLTIHAGLLAEAEDPAEPQPKGAGTPRLGRPALGAAAVLSLALLVGGGVAGAAAGADDQSPTCTPGEPCGAPPTLAQPLRNLTAWSSPALGFGLYYDSTRWRRTDSDDSGATLRFRGADMTLVVLGDEAAAAGPSEVKDELADRLREHGLSVAEDRRPQYLILGPAIGLHDGLGASYLTVVDTPQGIGPAALADVMAAGDDRTTVGAMAVTGPMDEDTRLALLAEADAVLNTVRLAGEGT